MKLSLLSLATISLASAQPAQKFILLPDSHHLGESAVQAHASGSPNWWGPSAAGRHFQVLYDASHFVDHCANSPITVTNLRFRGEDTEHNNGGQAFFGVFVHVYQTSLNSTAALNTVFGVNTAAAVSSVIFANLLTAVPVAPSIGSAPNNYIIDLPLTFTYDPSFAAAPNLLIDVVWQGHSPATDCQATSMIPIQDTSGTPALIRGRGLWSASAGAASGTASSFPPVIQVEFFGAGGYADLIPARSERTGAACGGSPSAFYQLFAHAQHFDLNDAGQSGLRLVPNTYPSPSWYCVGPGAAPIDFTGIPGAPNTQMDDLTYAHALPAGCTFDYPGALAPTPVIRPSTNGYVILDPASLEAGSDFTPTVAEFLGSAATHFTRVAPFWHDFSPNKNITLPCGDPAAGLYSINKPIAPFGPGDFEVLVTWYRVGRFNSSSEVFQEEHTMQCSLNCQTGVIEFRYQGAGFGLGRIDGHTASGTTNGIVGFTRGRIGGVSSVDPQSRDLSCELPFCTQVEATGHMGLFAESVTPPHGPVYGGRMHNSQAVQWSVNNIPAGTTPLHFGLLILSATMLCPGVQAAGITAPGCVLTCFGGPIVLHQVNVGPLPASLPAGPPFLLPPPCTPTLLGATVCSQYLVVDLNGGAPNIVSSASNAWWHTFGLR